MPGDGEAVDVEALVCAPLPGDVLADRAGQFDAVDGRAGGQQCGADIAAVDEMLVGRQGDRVEIGVYFLGDLGIGDGWPRS
ncbi:hypothetical protein [Streptomyces avermitilis]|uniref:hypothetical protein n=1 Tax=Streptomyces avermitilis TaxID=33903 RepID=UPI0033ACA4A8